MADFHEVRLPEDIERGAVGGPAFSTTIVTLASGHEQRNKNWSQTRGSWDIGYGITRLSELREVIAFFYARWGRAYGFRFKDWNDYQVIQQAVGVGDGSTTSFQIFKRYSSGSYYFDRDLKKIVEGSVSVWVDGVLTEDFTVDYDLGALSLTSAPGSGVLVDVSCEFDIPVRFDTDKLDVTAESFEVGSVPSINIVEIRL